MNTQLMKTKNEGNSIPKEDAWAAHRDARNNLNKTIRMVKNE